MLTSLREDNHAISFPLLRTGKHFMLILLAATLIIFSLPLSALAAYPNNSVGVSDNGIYYAHDKASRLKPMTPSGDEADSFAFCINRQKKVPSYSHNSHSGEYHRTDNASANDIYTEWLHNRGGTRSNRIDSAQLDDALRKLIYIYVADPTDIEGASGLRAINPNGIGFYNIIQNLVYHYTEGDKYTTYPRLEQNTAQKMVQDLLERPIDEVIPQNVDVRVNLYKAVPTGILKKSKYQSLVSGRVIVRPTTVHLSKKAVNGTSELEGAKLKVVEGENPTGKTITEWTSGKTTKTIQVTPGTYTMVETTAPAGYEIAEHITFQIDTTGTIKTKTQNGTYTTNNTNTITMLDKVKPPTTPPKPPTDRTPPPTTPAHPEITISKKTLGVETELQGATLRLVEGKSPSGAQIEEWETGLTPRSFGLTPGTYTLIEVKAPTGYKIARPVTFSVEADGTVTLQTRNSSATAKQKKVTMIDEPETPNTPPETPNTPPETPNTPPETPNTPPASPRVSKKPVSSPRVKNLAAVESPLARTGAAGGVLALASAAMLGTGLALLRRRNL
ncbi:thioester-forming surface-anchored protein [Winkia sp. UMB10116]|nr:MULTISPECIES: thioester-forming surface-anchored protein [unclassified Winkia]MDK6240612.1 thioester-forming surface-anchored protein [Winkia sp. UMB10116]MDK7906027.1 thioester-forming surface-anchored protein [Winkia sp. UMB0889B]MDK8340518.1 thioester-forming surface-anchored protein [Winkia sp. UMB3164B]